MDEPCSELDPIATAKIEELIYQLKARYTIVTVTHNMQQAGRISDYTAFFYLGRLIEFGPTTKIFTNPSERQTKAGRASALGGSRTRDYWSSERPSGRPHRFVKIVRRKSLARRSVH